jgi:hypothetical protein
MADENSIREYLRSWARDQVPGTQKETRGSRLGRVTSRQPGCVWATVVVRPRPLRPKADGKGGGTDKIGRIPIVSRRISLTTEICRALGLSSAQLHSVLRGSARGAMTRRQAPTIPPQARTSHTGSCWARVSIVAPPTAITPRPITTSILRE